MFYYKSEFLKRKDFLLFISKILNVISLMIYQQETISSQEIGYSMFYAWHRPIKRTEIDTFRNTLRYPA